MTALAWITGLLLLVGFGMSGQMKAMKQQVMLDAAEHLGFSQERFQLIGAAEMAGAIGVVLGLLIDDLSWLGLLAAIGLVLVGLGALYFHVKAEDSVKDMVPVSALTLVAVLHIIAIS